THSWSMERKTAMQRTSWLPDTQPGAAAGRRKAKVLGLIVSLCEVVLAIQYHNNNAGSSEKREKYRPFRAKSDPDHPPHGADRNCHTLCYSNTFRTLARADAGLPHTSLPAHCLPTTIRNPGGKPVDLIEARTKT
ncbi:MAG: hypothetical protein JW741_03730, partial [Sedimentisphaerales bacterium]|nr:hypothetical protein [Sedimentisphaerales bacterium]